MQEIVPPKLNKDTGLLSFILNRRNFLLGVGVALSFAMWSGSYGISLDQKILIQLAITFSLAPFLLNVYGRALHVFIFDAFRFLISKNETSIAIGRDISNGIVGTVDGGFSKVYRIEPINLSMSSEEEIYTFKRYLQSALFALENPVQIITIQRHSTQDSALEIEQERYFKLTGVLKDRCEQYILDYQSMTGTMERDFYLVISETGKTMDEASAKLIDQENSFCRLLEQTKIRLIPLDTSEVKKLSDQILD